MDSGSCGALDSRNKSCAVMSDAVSSFITPLTQMMRSRSSRLKMSNTRSPRLRAQPRASARPVRSAVHCRQQTHPDVSITIGTRV